MTVPDFDQLPEKKTSGILSLDRKSPSISSYSPPSSTKNFEEESTHGNTNGTTDGKLGIFSTTTIILGRTIGVGIYSVPSSVFNSTGSVGASILLWVIGCLISFSGLAVYLELGTGIPLSGGDRIYLERIFRRPYKLASCMFMTYVVVLNHSAPSCIVLGEYALFMVGLESNRWSVAGVAIGVVTLVCIIHAWYPNIGIRMINILSVGAMINLVVVIISGMAGAAMHIGAKNSPTGISTAKENFTGLFAGSSTQPYDYATGLLKILFCFRGYTTANQFISEVRNPKHTLRVAASTSLSLVSLSYVLVVISLFLIVDKEDFRTSGIIVTGHFFGNIFGNAVGDHIFPVLIITSAFGCIASMSYSQARVNQELGRDRILPFSEWLDAKKLNETPNFGLFLHWTVSVLIIAVPPPGQIFNFLLDVSGYPVSIIAVAISFGLLYLQNRPKENWSSPFHANPILTLIFAASNILLVIIPWLKPQSSHALDSKFPFYAYPTTAMAVVGSGAIYWFVVRPFPRRP
ncbi:hypothetical protein K3495_g8144 [Podosphaera aphanis]|nr:hypothetical protein K3495_g8144 [Podosphaera aphanis]